MKEGADAKTQILFFEKKIFNFTKYFVEIN